MADDLSLRVLNDQSRYIAAAIGQVWSAARWAAFSPCWCCTSSCATRWPPASSRSPSRSRSWRRFCRCSRPGVTLNIMSLGGLALGVGMLVDNSIVVLEAIDRHRRQGSEPAGSGARRGGGEVAGAVTASTLTTVACSFRSSSSQGVAGQLFFDLAVTVCLALVASLVRFADPDPDAGSPLRSATCRIPTQRLLRGTKARQQPRSAAVHPQGRSDGLSLRSVAANA